MHMTDIINQDQNESLKRDAGRRFLRILVFCIVIIATIVATVNLTAYQYMLRPGNQAIVQLLSGWGRIYKPILYDEIKPEVAVFGASWGRDGFDPIEVSQLLGRQVFNHGVSGGSAYETRRFGDSALNNSNLQAAIININTFYRNKSAARFRYGFDELILNVDAERRPHSFVDLRRLYSLALGGWAAGANTKLISTIRARDRGVARTEYLESYEQANFTRRNLKPVTEKIFPVLDNKVMKVTSENVVGVSVYFEEDELDLMIDGFCENGVDVYAYFTPFHAANSCDVSVNKELKALELLRHKQQNCRSRIRYFNFSYPNAMTLEGVLRPVTASQYYRPDGHPRPIAGLAMAAVMFDKPFPLGTMPALEQDFGVDLIRHEDAEGWLLKRAARCEGDWGEQGYSNIKQALESR